MPKTTVQFPVEHKLFDWARQTSCRLSGTDVWHVLLLCLEADFTVELYLAPICSPKARILDTDRKRRTSYIYFDPFEPFEYAWLEWTNVDSKRMEKLIGKAFLPSDFQPLVHGAKPLHPNWNGAYPESWGVMF